MTASAIRVPSRWCKWTVHSGRSLVSVPSREGGASVPARRHHRAAAGMSAGRGARWAAWWSRGGDVGAGAGGALEVGGQTRPVGVVGEVGVDGVGELAPAGGVGAGVG